MVKRVSLRRRSQPGGGVKQGLKVKFLGGAREVGRSALALSSGGSTILLDYGVQMNREPEFPLHIPPREVDAIFLSHAHLDHSGGIPLFHIRHRIPVYSTELTFELSRILITDFIELSGYYLPYEPADLEAMLDNALAVNFGEKVKVKDFTVSFLDAGHIPGSLQILVEAEGKKLLYTGDVNVEETRLLKGADLDYGEVSAVVVEATYAGEAHPERRKLEEIFVARIREVVERGGTVLIPAFSVGRSQEVLCILEAYGFEHQVYMDGLALEANEVMLRHPKYFRDYSLLKRALEKAKWITTWRERKQAVKKPCVIISPAGMLKGGAAAYYVGRVAKEERNAIFLVSFQVPGTPGRTLLEERKVFVNGKPKPVQAEVEFFHFSSHTDGEGLKTLLRSLEGSPKVYAVHGSPEKCELLAEWVRSELGFEAEAPQPGETCKI
ncbi:MBL fold metallo-hydrolase [Candidatus Bathyarchaeota archaeon]|nr:MAG: MBL fold metallo-hydrolase [Candidatus Bathyarchaeota archaeon]